MASFKTKAICGAALIALIVLAGEGALEYARLPGAKSELLGSVDTEFKFFGADSQVVVEIFDDPLVSGCRATFRGLKRTA